MDKPLNPAIISIEVDYQCKFDKAIYQGIINATKKLLHGTRSTTDK